MAGKPIQVKNGPKALMAWLVLGIILVWVAVNWPQGPERIAVPVPSTAGGTTTETTSSLPQTKEKRTQAEVIAPTLNFRSHPEYEDRTIIKTLTMGTVVDIIERKDGWLNVELDTGQSGYVADGPGFIRIVE